MSGHRWPIIAVSHTNNRPFSLPQELDIEFLWQRGVGVGCVSAWRQGTETKKRGSKKGDSPVAVWATLSHGLLVAWEEGDSSILFSLPCNNDLLLPYLSFGPESDRGKYAAAASVSEI